jgi:hypothetical protein
MPEALIPDVISKTPAIHHTLLDTSVKLGSLDIPRSKTIGLYNKLDTSHGQGVRRILNTYLVLMSSSSKRPYASFCEEPEETFWARNFAHQTWKWSLGKVRVLLDMCIRTLLLPWMKD